VAIEPLSTPIDIGLGDPIVMLPGFAMPPSIYRRTAELLAGDGRSRVVVPEIYRVSGGWSRDVVVDRLRVTLDALGLDPVTMIAHSFAGTVELSFAARWPERVVELVFCDTLAVSREWPLADEATRHPLRFLWMMTPSATAAFTRTVVTHPREIAQAAWLGFTGRRTSAAEQVAAHHLPAHVLWANRDSVLSRDDGQAFAKELDASFDVVREPNGRAIDHDWMYRHPELFVQHVEDLHLIALR
jgi:pimeloyl-ACP methyl ester carboxylesterase